MTLEKVSEFLHKMKPNVNDFFSITARHYINGGEEAIKHFCFILNAIISDMANVTSPTLNTVYANILYKGHGKDKSIDNSYRTISTCSLIAKTLDLYIRELCSLNWEEVQAKTQFQGKGMSHELSALLLTERIQHSTLDQKLPIYTLFLDA